LAAFAKRQTAPMIRIYRLKIPACLFVNDLMAVSFLRFHRALNGYGVGTFSKSNADFLLYL
jgi:hypothetical protein